MDGNGLAGQAGKRLKQLRLRLGLTLREVEARSLQLAEKRQNHDYFISRAWLNNVENGSYTPSIYKLYSLSVIYRDSWTNIISFFGLRPSDIGRDQALFGLGKTHLVQGSDEADVETVVLPLRSREELQLDDTTLLSRLVQIWGEIPVRLINHLDLRKSMYGYIGLNDFTMYPLIRPGSFVQVDQRVTKIQTKRWRTEYDRPIYFVELREGYACSWCEQQDGRLLLIPHPLSPCNVRSVEHGVDAEIVGQVTAVAMRITDPPAGGTDAAAALPKRV